MSNKLLIIFLLFAGCSQVDGGFDHTPVHVRFVNDLHQNELRTAITFINENLGDVLVYGGGRDIDIEVRELDPHVYGYAWWHGDEITTSCDIAISPNTFKAPYPETVIAHELLHCLGRHNHTYGIMKNPNAKDVPLTFENISDDVFEWFNKYYEEE